MEIAEKHGKPVIIMEPARGGKLCTLPDDIAAPLMAAKPGSTQAEWAYRFCWNLPNVLAVLSGASNVEQMRENVATYAANESSRLMSKRRLMQWLLSCMPWPRFPAPPVTTA